MNIKKILIGGVLLLGINPCPILGGNVEPEWLEKLRVKNSPYIGVMWSNGKTNIQDKEVTLGKATEMWVNHGRHNLLKDKKIGVAVLAKIVIEQSEPCYAIPKEFGLTKNIRGETIANDIKKAIKLNRHTVEVLLGYDGAKATTGISDKIRFGLNDKKQATEDNSIMILGKDLECLKESNEETWRVYWYLKDEWVLMAEEEFYLKGE
jgi:hypothetical protein